MVMCRETGTQGFMSSAPIGQVQVRIIRAGNPQLQPGRGYPDRPRYRRRALPFRQWFRNQRVRRRRRYTH